MKLEGKVAIVTGASRGIGRAVSLGLAREGASLVAVSRNKERLDSLSVELGRFGGRSITISADVSNENECAKIVNSAETAFGKIDVLVNNAGLLGIRDNITSIDTDEWRRVFETNTTAVFVLSKLVAGRMKTKGGGSIINLTSGVVPQPRARWGAYLPSKFAVEGLSLMMAEELKEFGVRVNMVDPGRTNTDMIEAAFPDIPRDSFKPPEDLVGTFVYLASDSSANVTGSRIRVR